MQQASVGQAWYVVVYSG